MSRTTWVRDTLISAGVSEENADRAMAEVRAEARAEDIALIEDRADDADFTEEPLYIVGLRSAADLLKNAASSSRTAGDEQPETGLKARVTRAIHALKTPTPSGSQYYRSGWEDGVDASIDAARDAIDGGDVR